LAFIATRFSLPWLRSPLFCYSVHRFRSRG
jgi:hypothetical protein